MIPVKSYNTVSLLVTERMQRVRRSVRWYAEDDISWAPGVDAFENSVRQGSESKEGITRTNHLHEFLQLLRKRPTALGRNWRVEHQKINAPNAGLSDDVVTRKDQLKNLYETILRNSKAKKVASPAKLLQTYLPFTKEEFFSQEHMSKRLIVLGRHGHGANTGMHVRTQRAINNTELVRSLSCPDTYEQACMTIHSHEIETDRLLLVLYAHELSYSHHQVLCLCRP
jgi:hypothetical protein